MPGARQGKSIERQLAADECALLGACNPESYRMRLILNNMNALLQLALIRKHLPYALIM